MLIVPLKTFAYVNHPDHFLLRSHIPIFRVWEVTTGETEVPFYPLPEFLTVCVPDLHSHLRVFRPWRKKVEDVCVPHTILRTKPDYLMLNDIELASNFYVKFDFWFKHQQKRGKTTLWQENKVLHQDRHQALPQGSLTNTELRTQFHKNVTENNMLCCNVLN